MAYKGNVLALEGSLLYSPKRSYLAVVAIDFGTTYSGFAFSFIKDQGKDAIFMNMDWGNEQGAQTSKTPTCLLLKPDLEFDSFGYEAIEKYSSLGDESEEKEYLFFKHFKMALHSDETLNSRTVIRAANGRSVEAKTVFARSINFLKDEAVKVIRQRTGDNHFNADEIQWVLTVPAIWTPRAKQFMREAAYEAGVGKPENADQLIIALEPEAAAIFCMEKNMSDFLEESGCRSVDGVLSKINTHYIVADIGGGTLDVTVHEIQDDGRIREIYKVTGGPHGGMYVNQKFESLLDELFGTPMLQSYREQFPSDWLCLINEFEGKKRGKRVLDSSLMTNIRLPRSFVSQIKRNRGTGIDRYGEREVKIKSNEYLSLSSGMMRKLFTPVVDKIKEHLNNLLQKPELSKVQIMLLVGGFAESAFLQEEIRKEFSGRNRILVPHHASIAVAQGAVIFGKKPTTITERVMGTTYGIRCLGDFESGVHPEEKKTIRDGIFKCRDLFSCFVKENEVVELGQRIKKIYHPSKSTSTRVTVAFHVTTNPNTQFTTDPEVTKIGNISIQTPDTWKGRDRDIEVCMYFGGTEITATAWDVSSGNNAQTNLDFFSRS
ncbi:heat shock 70 kDa protein 12A-like isoform X1 [Stylophora pistillata]|uniref:heat shock 70 kDa protein 12A-like isoform X1 n=1 Tax=Stylophora pistillata TaxID=50429 RepID=UPI000C0466D8|nr:heat shock 70 kDa protein 12A-like isoform X1 [Stylophora pistillata]